MAVPVYMGQDMAGAFANLPIGQRPSETGVPYHATDLGRTFISDNKICYNSTGWQIPTDGHIVYSASGPRYLFDHFRTLDTTTWDIDHGTDDVAADAALVGGSNKTSGEVVLTSGDAGTNMAADGSAIASPLAFEAEEGQLTLICKAKLASAANAWFFIGFTDVLPSTTLEEPVSLATATYTTNATDACGFMFDTAATTDTVRLVGVADDTDGTHVDTSVEPGTDYREYKLVLTADGTLTGYIDGVSVGSVADAVTPSVDLCAIAAVNTRTTASKTMTLDYIGVK